ncbi:hypothetical protein NFI96_008892 [Prochilodus magdalenae]|nr:hypothetical protein NFI96_008892 [Prochilodus magdalenae]
MHTGPLPRLSLTPRHRHQTTAVVSYTRLSWSDSEWQRVIFSDESRFSLGGDAQRIRVWEAAVGGQHQDERFVVTHPEGLVSLHLHPYRTICRNCVRMFKLHGMDYHRTPLGTSTAPYRDVWRDVLLLHFLRRPSYRLQRPQTEEHRRVAGHSGDNQHTRTKTAKLSNPKYNSGAITSRRRGNVPKPPLYFYSLATLSETPPLYFYSLATLSETPPLYFYSLATLSETPPLYFYSLATLSETPPLYFYSLATLSETPPLYFYSLATLSETPPLYFYSLATLSETPPLYFYSLATLSETPPLYFHSLATLSETPPLYFHSLATLSETPPLYFHSLATLSETPPLYFYSLATLSETPPLYFYSLATLSETPPLYFYSLATLSETPPLYFYSLATFYQNTIR